MSLSDERRRLSARGLVFIAAHEGFSDRRYKDPAGKPTAGFGHLIQPGETFGVLSVPGALRLLLADVAVAETAIHDFITVPLAQHQFDALVSFTFNLGRGALARSTLRKRINARDIDAADEFPKWCKGRVGGVLKPLPGLVRRREDERAMWLGELEEA